MKKQLNWLFISTLFTGLILVCISAKLLWDSACDEVCGMQHYIPGSGFVGGPCRQECSLEIFGNGFFWLGLVVLVIGVLLIAFSMSNKVRNK